MIKTERSGNTAKAVIYEEVGSYDFNGSTFSNVLTDLEKYANKIDIHLHTYGGSVMEGNIIFNAIAKSKSEIHIHIDGIAASMGAIICMAAKKVWIAENGFMMLHCPMTYAGGNADNIESEVKVLRAMENEFVKAICAKTKRLESEIRAYFDGKDHWFTAKEAFEAGLVDGFDTKQVTTEIDGISSQSAKSYGIAAMFQNFKPLSSCLNPTASLTEALKGNGLNRASWTWEDWQRYDQKGLEEMAKDKDPLFKELYVKTFGVCPQGFESVASTNVVKAISTNGYAIQGREHWTINDWQKFDIKGLEAMAKNKDPYFKELYVKTFGVCPQGFESVAATNVVKAISTNGYSIQGREHWTIDDWQKFDPKGMEAMAKNKDPYFKELYFNAFGVVPQGW